MAEFSTSADVQSPEGSAPTITQYVAGEALSKDDWVYLSASDGKVYKAVNSTKDSSKAIGFVKIAVDSGAVADVSIVTSGTILEYDAADVTKELTYCVSSTAGNLEPNADAADGEHLFVVFTAYNSSHVVCHPTYCGVIA